MGENPGEDPVELARSPTPGVGFAWRLQLFPAPGVLSASGFKGRKMRKLLVAIAIALPLTLLSTAGNAKGCLKGAAVGGVVGHVAGHHAVVGAAAGCVIEHHREKVADRETAKQNAAAQHGATVQNKPAAPAAQATPSPDQHW
jgi:hypothetical protein